MTRALLLDAHFPPQIADQLRQRGHDARAAAEDPELRDAGDEDLLKIAAAEGRFFVTRDRQDFTALAVAYGAECRSHAGIVMVTTSAFPQDRSATGRLVTALEGLLSGGTDLEAGVHYLRSPSR